jgi:hypothetical protein
MSDNREDKSNTDENSNIDDSSSGLKKNSNTVFSILHEEKSRILSFIGKSISNSKNELEARIFPQITGQKEIIDYYQYNKILQNFILSKEQGGLGLKTEFKIQVNVTSEKNPNIRETIVGKDAIKLYWLSNDIKLVQQHSPNAVYQMIKTRKDFINLKHYPVRIAINEENITGKKDFKLLNDTKFSKEYRFQNRVSVFTEDNLFRIDFTSVKFESGKTFKQSKVVNSFPIYEIEIEFINSNDSVSKEDIFESFIKHTALLLSIYYNTTILLSNSLKNEVLDKYKLLISTDKKLRKSNRKNNKNKYNFNDYITAKPVTLHRDNVRSSSSPNILKNYAVTFKADGMNMLLYVFPKESTDITEETGNLFMIDSNFHVLPTGITIDSWDNSILEGEYIKEHKKLYLYDMLYAKKLDIRNKPLESFVESQTSRLSYLKDFIKSIPESKYSIIDIIEKPYLFGNDKEIFLKSKKLWDDRNALEFHVDGLIFAPASDPYPNKPGTWAKLFKWKPSNLNSMDFLIETVKGSNRRDKLFPYVSTELSEITQFKKVRLYSTGISDKFNRKTGKLDRKPYPKLFKEVEIPVDSDGNMIAIDPLSGLREQFSDDTIVEFSFKKDIHFSWIPIRVRHEKTKRYRKYNDNFGNFHTVVEDIWKSIQNPVTTEMITTGEIPDNVVNENKQYAVISQNRRRLPYQKFHTLYVKKKLLTDVALTDEKDRGAGYLIDFGACRGGDLNRWKEIGYTKVVGIDADSKCVQEAINRHQNALDNNYNVTFLCGDLSKLIYPNQESACEPTDTPSGIIEWKELMKESLPQKYMFDVVSSQFVIHYFFDKELSLRSYLQNVTDNLRIGGYFVGSTFDGKKVYNLLKRKKFVEGKLEDETIWKITKMYDKKKFTDGKPNWGMSIDVFVDSIGIPHKEGMVSFKYLEKIAKEYGLELEKMIPFEEMWNEGKNDLNNAISYQINAMSEDEKTFSFLSSGFIFKKVKNAPDSSYKKIIKLQKKNNSVK